MENITYSKDEMLREFGEHSINWIVEGLAKCLTKERNLELMRNSHISIIYQDYMVFQFKPDYYWYLAILASWHIKDDRVKVVINTVTFYANQEELDAAKKQDALKAIKLNQN